MRPGKQLLIFAEDEYSIGHLLCPLRVRGLKVEVAFTGQQFAAALKARNRDLALLWASRGVTAEMLAVAEMARLVAVPSLGVFSALGDHIDRLHCNSWVVSPSMFELWDALKPLLGKTRGPRPMTIEPLDEEKFPLKHLEVGGVAILGVPLESARNMAAYWGNKYGRKFTVKPVTRQGFKFASVCRAA